MTDDQTQEEPRVPNDCGNERRFGREKREGEMTGIGILSNRMEEEKERSLAARNK